MPSGFAQGAQVKERRVERVPVGVGIHASAGRDDVADADLDRVVIERVARAVPIWHARAVALVQVPGWMRAVPERGQTA